jgi:UDP-N-acetylglucosamine:LPS N-acetylglucosamine transferase
VSKKVLITGVDAGGGHVAVMDALYKTLHGHEDKQIRVLKYYSPQKYYDKIYRQIARFPRLLELLHYSSIRLVRWFKSLVILPELPGARQTVEETKPDVVICTHPFQTLAFTTVRKELGMDFKIVSCICDYGDPKEYIAYAPPVDHYLVRDESTKKEALKYLPGQDGAITIFGTVVNEPFERYGTASNKQVAQEFEAFFKESFGEKAAQFDPSKPKVLVIGGSGWVRKSKTLIEAMAESGKYNLLVCCGKDELLQDELCQRKGVFCFGFMPQDKLALVERAADVAVMATLAPASMYELLTINKYPLFVHRYHARQEAPHIQLLSDWEIGFYEPDDAKMMALLDDYLTDRGKYRHCIDNAARRCAEEKSKARDNYKFVLDIAA